MRHKKGRRQVDRRIEEVARPLLELRENVGLCRAFFEIIANDEIRPTDSHRGKPATPEAKAELVRRFADEAMLELRESLADATVPLLIFALTTAVGRARRNLGGVPQRLTHDPGSFAVLERIDRRSSSALRQELLQHTDEYLAELVRDFVGEWRHEPRKPHDLKAWERKAAGVFARARRDGCTAKEAATAAELDVQQLRALVGSRAPEKACRRFIRRAEALGLDPLTL